MKKGLLVISFILLTCFLQAQKDSIAVSLNSAIKANTRETTSPNINIYPVPVRENNFSIKTDREMSSVKVTNMIGQDIFKALYKNPLSFTRVTLPNPSRGIYLVTISFVDGTRVVKKVMVEKPE